MSLFSVGVHQQINPVAQGAQPYGMVSVNYNLASRAINKHLDRAVEAHDEWKKLQEGDVVRGMEVLRQQLVDSMVVQEAKLQSLPGREPTARQESSACYHSRYFRCLRLPQSASRCPTPSSNRDRRCQFPNQAPARVPRKELLSDLAPALG